MGLRFRNFAFAALATLATVIFAVIWVIPVRRGVTSPISGARAVASLEQVTLGGIKQWLLIRGQDTRNPLLLFLHGGPGMPMMYLAHDFQRPLEKQFVVVQWDRRGAGKSYSADTPAQSISVTHEISDTCELIDLLRVRFGQQKVYLLGFSYGTYLGALVTERRPELLHAYVAVGQLACSEEENRKIQDEWIRQQAMAAHKAEALRELAGSKPLDREKWLFEFGGELYHAKSWWPLLWSGIRCSEYTLTDIRNIKIGVNFTARNMKYNAIHGSLLEKILELAVPVYLFTGRHDYTDPFVCTEAFYARLHAPIKKLVWFDNSAHFVFLDEPETFAAAMNKVRRDTESWEKSHQGDHGAQ
jgi:pimeloyl-ACP methyl ester carboxylesterase